MPSVTTDQLTIGEVVFTAADIASAEVGFSPVGQPLVNVRFSPAGAIRLDALTRAALGKELPIRWGTMLLSSPRVMEPISGGLAQISGLHSVEEARLLAKRITGR